MSTYFTEARRAIRGIGKYGLSTEYEHFYVQPATWIQWSDERRNQHFNAFMEALPKTFAFRKAANAGRKPGITGKNKRRVNLPEPEVFIDRLTSEDNEPVVTPLKIRKTSDKDNTWKA